MLLLLLTVACAVTYWWPKFGAEARHFPGGRDVSETLSWMTGGGAIPQHQGGVATAKPLPPLPMPRHPYQDNNGYAGAHGDSYNSGVMPHAGPLGLDPQVMSRMTSALFSGCSTQHFDNRGRVVTICVGFTGSRLLLLDAADLSILAAKELPALAGWYFRMDQHGQVVLPAGDLSLQVYRVEEASGSPQWVRVAHYDLSSLVPEAKRGIRSVPMDLVADWQGNWWFGIWDPAIIGYRDGDRNLLVHEFEGEILENGMAANPQGIYFVTDQYLYGMRAGPQGPEVFLRFPYDAGGGVNALSKGSGTTPVLLGEQLIAFGDNASPQPNLLVYRLDDVADEERLVCKMPLFKPHRGSLENSFIGYDHSIIIENNKHFAVFGDSRAAEPGIARVDVRPDLSGCNLVWETYEVRAGSGSKLSTATGLIYTHELLQDTGLVKAWYITALNFETGSVAWRHYLGSGKQWDNAMLTLSIGPDGLLTSGTFAGLVALRDRP